MNFIPFQSETLVSTLSKEEVMEHISKKTLEVNFLDKRTESSKNVAFNGIVGKNSFRISRVINRSNTFLPLILGEVEDTARGSILFLEYKLFPGALFFVVFWSIILLAFSAFFFGLAQNIINGSICLVMAILNYALALFFFHRQVKISRKEFHQLINLQIKD